MTILRVGTRMPLLAAHKPPSAAATIMHPASGLFRVFLGLCVLLRDDAHRSLLHAFDETLGLGFTGMEALPLGMRKLIERSQKAARDPWLESVALIENLFLPEPSTIHIDLSGSQFTDIMQTDHVAIFAGQANCTEGRRSFICKAYQQLRSIAPHDFLCYNSIGTESRQT